jgi:hypothetical protein
MNMRALAILVAAGPTWLLSSYAADWPTMLDQPGIMESIRKLDPERAMRLSSIVSAAEALGCGGELSKQLTERFGVTGAKCDGLSYTTEPQKVRLLFTYEGSRYSNIITPRWKRHAD